MIIRTYRQCLKAVARERIVIATDDERIARVCRGVDARVVMTSPACLTGTDRVAEVARIIPADMYVNVQGDEPVFDPDDIKALIAAADGGRDHVINGYCAISDVARFRSGSTPKVVIRPDGRLLYMSRGPIPTSKVGRFIRAWRQVCAYAFSPDALEAFSASGYKTPLEEIEDIEILRFLELGWDVRMIEMGQSSIAVDTPEDVERAEAAIRRLGL
jgi:3-deoxy-manno-octulosonate cytidylyltransferase (CMP-KDO synthetase)